MKNRKFHWQLRKLTLPCDCVPPEPCKSCKGKGRVRVTVGRIAEAVFVNRAALNDVINNKPGRGGSTRWKVARFFRQKFPKESPELLAALGWDEKGDLAPSPQPSPPMGAREKTTSQLQQSVPRGTVLADGAPASKEAA